MIIIFFKFQTFAPGSGSFLFGQQIVQPNWKGIGPEDLDENVLYSLSTLGEIQFSTLDDTKRWPNYHYWFVLKEMVNFPYYLRY